MEEWKLITFNPIPHCNIYSLHVISLDFSKAPLLVVVDIYGDVICMKKGISQLNFDLVPHLNEEKANLRDGTVELVASDTAVPIGNQSSDEFFLATCWVVHDDYFIPERFFAALYKINLKTSKVEMWQKFELSNAPTLCRLTKTSPIEKYKLYWLIFSHSVGVQAFFINSDTKEIELLKEIGEVFPVLEIGTLPGAATRSHCWIAQGYRFSLVGFDTGYVVASVCTMESGVIIDRKAIKFSGPISVLKLIDTNDEELKTSILISSTIGPAVVWSLSLVDEYLQWNLKFELEDSEKYDSIISGNTNHEFIFIGTYSEELLIYDLKTVLNENVNSVLSAPILSKIIVGSPILSVQHIPADDSIIILSYKGFHKFVQLRGRTIENVIKFDDSLDGSLTEATDKLDLDKIPPLD